MDELILTPSELKSLMISASRLGYAAGRATKGSRTLENSTQKIVETIEGLKKTHKRKYR